MSNSGHKAEVVKVQITDHPDADKLDVAHFWSYTSCVRKGDFKDGDLAVFVPPMSVVPVDREEFRFLDKGDGKPVKITAKKLRGVHSYGLLLKAPEGAKEGDDYASFYGITHYEDEPDAIVEQEKVVSWRRWWHKLLASWGWYRLFGKDDGRRQKGFRPSAHFSKYDIENLRRYSYVLNEGETVWVTEKLHGSSMRIELRNEVITPGSRSYWKNPNDDSEWSIALRANPKLSEFIRDNPEYVLFGECVNRVKNFHYIGPKEKPEFLAFDIWDKKENRYLDPKEFFHITKHFDIPTVPLISTMEYNLDRLEEMCRGKSWLNSRVCLEGLVIKPDKERYNNKIGRVAMKLKSPEFLMNH